MSKTNPAEPEEATDQPQRRVISGPPRFDQQLGAIGSCCKNCGQGIRQHVGGFCNPDDATQVSAEQELEEAQGMQQVEEGITASEERQETIEQYAKRHGGVEAIGGTEDYAPADTDRIEIVEQALDLLQILPDCPERDQLARQCAIMVSMKMNMVGYVVSNEEEQK